MKNIIFLLLIIITYNLNAQEITYSPEAAYYKSFYRHKILNEMHNSNMSVKNHHYPKDALKDGIQGDVVFSISITNDGKIERLDLIESPHKLLADNALEKLSKLNLDWSDSEKIDSLSIHEYLLAFRYRIYKNDPVDIKKRCKRLSKKGKYTKALKLYNNAIVENKLDTELFISRAEVKKQLGDFEGYREDNNKAKKRRLPQN